MLSFFNKKSDEKKEEEEKPNSKIENLLSARDEAEKEIEKEQKKEEVNSSLTINKPLEKELDKVTIQCIEIGMDMKNEVEKFSKAFFNSKNNLKKESYLRFQSYLAALPYEKKNELQNLEYLDFKEREEQILTMLKNGFAQFLSKGSNLDEETRRTIELIFGDIKKMPSRGHRFWYYKIYIWQTREEV